MWSFRKEWARQEKSCCRLLKPKTIEQVSTARTRVLKLHLEVLVEHHTEH
jgi:hypothetical protein